MTSPKGVDETFSGKEYEDVYDWTERLQMAAEVRDYTPDKLFKVARLNLRGKAKDWVKRHAPPLTTWEELEEALIAKFGQYDAVEVKGKLDAIKQELRQRVQAYYDRLERWFDKGRIPDPEQIERFISGLRVELQRACIGRTYENIDAALSNVLVIEKGLSKIGDTPFEALP